MAANPVENYMENVINEPLLAKRMRKDPDATTRKSVVVLKTGDVGFRNDMVFMPNTIEMAQLKKPDKGQFKTNIPISSKMTETDVKQTLMEHFPILTGKRFYCASVVENRTRLEFHGERCIWDGHFIKKTIKGNSALYIFLEEEHQEKGSALDSGGSEVVEDSGYESSIREQVGVKRSFDQIATRSELTRSVTPVKTSLSSMNTPVQPILEKLPDVISTLDGPPGNNTSYSNLVSGQAEEGSEKSDIELSNERPLMTGQQEAVAPSNTILFLQQPLSVGGIPIFMIPTTGGITVAPAAIGGNNALNTVPAQQSIEMPLLPASNSPGLQSAPQASTLAPQLQSLHISSASQPSQNIVTAEASILGSSEALTTVDTTEISQLISLTGPEGDKSDSVGEQQVTEKFQSPDQEQVAEKESAGAIAVAGDQGSSRPFTLQTSEFEPLDALDSEFETSGKPEDNTVQDVHSTTAGAAMRGDVYVKNVMLLKKEELVQRNGKILMPTTIEMARMRKTGQYKKKVQFSKSMSEEEVRKTIQEEFPTFDLSEGFSCASISNQDSTLQFHGSPRVWDGRTIRRFLKGNSALYIVTEEIRVPPRTVIDQNPLSMLCDVAVQKERVEVRKASGSPPNRAPTEQEQADVEMAEDISGAFPEQGPFTPLSSEDSGKSEDILRIFPQRGPIEGQDPFILVFEDNLPLDIGTTWADFGKEAVYLERRNDRNLIGIIPASREPGKVIVTVHSSNGRILGETDFVYYDKDRETLLRLVTDPKLQSEFFRHWANSMAVETKRTERHDLSQPWTGFSQPNQVLRSLVYTAEKSNVQQLVKMFFNYFARGAIHIAYKEEKILPESVAKYHSNNKLENYLAEKDKRFSEEIEANQEFSPTVDRLEPANVAEKEERRLCGYLGDVDTSSDSETSDFEDKPQTALNKDLAEKEAKEVNELVLFQTRWGYFDAEDLGNLRPNPQERGLLEANNQRQDLLLVNRNMNFDQNSMADKNRRAEEIRKDETSDTGPIPL